MSAGVPEQREQNEALGAGLTSPAAQGTQADAPVEKAPGGHDVRAVRVGLGSKPGGATGQYDAPNAFDAVPSAHGLQPWAEPTESSSLYSPAAHGVQFTAPGSAQDPTEQSLHAVRFGFG